jgi:peptidyl-prolyl cis-trans isomerase B (cyclophilin B)
VAIGAEQSVAQSNHHTHVEDAMGARVSVVLSAVLACAIVAGAAESSAKAKPRVRLETSKGVIVMELDPQAAPKTVENILQYVKDGFYDGTIFHRVIKNFMVQGGGFTKDMQEKKTRPPITNEADNGLKNDLGTVAMARTPDPHSASAQFFINTKKNDFLNFTSKDPQGWGYCVFGKVVEGLDVVKSIESVATTSQGMFQDVPVTPVEITKATIVAAAAAPAQKPAAATAPKSAEKPAGGK